MKKITKKAYAVVTKRGRLVLVKTERWEAEETIATSEEYGYGGTYLIKQCTVTYEQ